jgi:alkanesulfonate monooxygenase SsuD/methylene tetrahydromethanopterin reductase-like flavin-dependent oxidoreductase (luciferase family)
MPTPEQARDYPYTEAERLFVEQRLHSAVIGSPTTVRNGLLELGQRHGVDELMITTSVHSHTDRLHSFSLVAEAMNAQFASTR